MIRMSSGNCGILPGRRARLGPASPVSVQVNLWLPAGVRVIGHRFGFGRADGRGYEETLAGPEGPPERVGRDMWNPGINAWAKPDIPTATPPGTVFSAEFLGTALEDQGVRYLIDYQVDDPGRLASGATGWILASTDRPELSVLVPAAARNVRHEVVWREVELRDTEPARPLTDWSPSRVGEVSFKAIGHASDPLGPTHALWRVEVASRKDVPIEVRYIVYWEP